ncbi:MAG TPA: hypothetical protein VMS17_19295 [Gemmataceae bacterium]|nr:hypothetical protein [Gemmataceae bacterium]
MPVSPLLSQVLDDEALTRGLGDAEARVLVEWLVDAVEQLECIHTAPAAEVHRLCRRARALSRFVLFWCVRRDRGAATQLAAVERFAWPLPDDADADACELMQQILTWEGENACRS